jgi:hypothetical protein
MDPSDRVVGRGVVRSGSGSRYTGQGQSQGQGCIRTLARVYNQVECGACIQTRRICVEQHIYES